MADTGENRQISARTNAKEAETIRASKKMVCRERSTAKANHAAFGGPKRAPVTQEKDPTARTGA